MWKYQIDGQEHGPLDTKQLRQLARTGKLRPTDLIWREGLKGWVPAGKAKGLFPATEAPHGEVRDGHLDPSIPSPASADSCETIGTTKPGPSLLEGELVEAGPRAKRGGGRLRGLLIFLGAAMGIALIVGFTMHYRSTPEESPVPPTAKTPGDSVSSQNVKKLSSARGLIEQAQTKFGAKNYQQAKSLLDRTAGMNVLTGREKKSLQEFLGRTDSAIRGQRLALANYRAGQQSLKSGDLTGAVNRFSAAASSPYLDSTVTSRARVSLSAAESRLKALTAKPPIKPRSAPPKTLALSLGQGETLKLKLIPAGKFQMGSSLSAEDVSNLFVFLNASAYKSEHPQHQVTISTPFYMGIYEITQSQWKAVMGTEPWDGEDCAKSGASHAASYISWDDATKFCEVLSKKTGKKVMLPAEAQWEYSCRAGSKTLYSFGNSASIFGDYAWYEKNAGDNAHAVGQKKPNAFDLYDMHGNVCEWCRDGYDEKFYAKAKNVDPENTTVGLARVLRGGSWNHSPDGCRAANRSWSATGFRGFYNGFRVVVVSGLGVD